MKDKVLKVLFIISFLPALLILILGIVSISHGSYTFFGGRIYGFDGFLDTIFWLGYVLFTCIIPLLPICLFFQICYILRKTVKKIKDIGAKKYVTICSVIGIVLLIIWFFLVGVTYT